VLIDLLELIDFLLLAVVDLFELLDDFLVVTLDDQRWRLGPIEDNRQYDPNKRSDEV
jgi:hypothetical protein